MRRTLWPVAALATVALIGAGCSNDPADNGGASTASSTDRSATIRDKTVKFAACMRDNGVRDFPDPGPSGRLTVDEVANGTSLDTSSPTWERAIATCKDLQPPGFTGDGKRSPEKQDEALEFAQCIRDNGVEDFPDPEPGGPLVDTNRIPSANGRGGLEIPGLTAAMEACGDLVRDQVGRP